MTPEGTIWWTFPKSNGKIHRAINGKIPTISMAIFHSFLYVHQRVTLISNMKIQQLSRLTWAHLLVPFGTLIFLQAVDFNFPVSVEKQLFIYIYNIYIYTQCITEFTARMKLELSICMWFFMQTILKSTWLQFSPFSNRKTSFPSLQRPPGGGSNGSTTGSLSGNDGSTTTYSTTTRRAMTSRVNRKPPRRGA